MASPAASGRAALSRLSVPVAWLLITAAGGRPWTAAAAALPAIQAVSELGGTNSVLTEEPCPVSLELGARANGTQNVTISVPERCGCSEVELSIRQRDGIPCAVTASGCSWMRAHGALSAVGGASFLVAVGGQFRPVARCRQPRAVAEWRRRAGRMLVGTPRVVAGLDLTSWNASISAAMLGDDLVVEVTSQVHDGAADAYFPELYVTLYQPPLAGESRRYRRVAYRRVPFSPAAGGARAEFANVALGYRPGYRVDVRPAGSWVCQGANDGCQRRYAELDNLLALTQHARESVDA